MAEFMHELLYYVVRARCRRKESSRSLSHLLMSFSLYYCYSTCITLQYFVTVYYEKAQHSAYSFLSL